MKSPSAVILAPRNQLTGEPSEHIQVFDGAGKLLLAIIAYQSGVLEPVLEKIKVLYPDLDIYDARNTPVETAMNDITQKMLSKMLEVKEDQKPG
jgi:hypothetical protein